MRWFVSLLLISVIPAGALHAADTPVLPGPSVARDEAPLPPDVLTNEGVVQLSNAGFSDGFIVQKIQLSRTRLDTTVEGLTFLRRNSVSERLIEYVLQHEAQPMPPAAAPGTQTGAPALVRMKIVKTKLLVPAEDIPGGSGLFHRQASYYAVYPGTQPDYALPAHPLLQSPVFPGSGAPPLNPAGTQPVWLAGR
jgi:hypothetical protein